MRPFQPVLPEYNFYATNNPRFRAPTALEFRNGALTISIFGEIPERQVRWQVIYTKYLLGFPPASWRSLKIFLDTKAVSLSR